MEIITAGHMNMEKKILKPYAGSIVPSYDSMFTGLNPSGNSWSITSLVKQRGCAAPLYRATSRRSSDGVRLRFLARA